MRRCDRCSTLRKSKKREETQWTDAREALLRKNKTILTQETQEESSGFAKLSDFCG